MFLAKFLAQMGVCSRRNAALLIKDGKVLVNRQIVTNPAYMVQESDIVSYDHQKYTLPSAPEKKYLILNKPAGLVTTTSDQFGRMSVVDYLKAQGVTDILLPVGRLDYETTGLLLLTNDGDFAYKMSHPKFEVTKCYSCHTNRQFRYADFLLLKKGIYLEDGFIKPDNIMMPQSKRGNEVLITIHSGRNRIVRRMFDALGYNIKSLHRTAVGPYSLGSLKIGEWRFFKI